MIGCTCYGRSKMASYFVVSLYNFAFAKFLSLRSQRCVSIVGTLKKWTPININNGRVP